MFYFKDIHDIVPAFMEYKCCPILILQTYKMCILHGGQLFVECGTYPGERCIKFIKMALKIMQSVLLATCVDTVHIQ